MTIIPVSSTETTSIAAGMEIDREAILKAFNINPRDPKAQAMILACEKYGLDPLLKHAVLISGNLYVTRDGLLHVAHRSGRLDGIVVEDEGQDAKEWWAKVTVYVKGQSHGYTYRGRYPKSGRQKEYGPEMAVKVAEVMALRRAFGVTGIATVEEQWDKSDDYSAIYRKSSGEVSAGAPPAGDPSPGNPATDRAAPPAGVEPAAPPGGVVGTAPAGSTTAPGGKDATGGEAGETLPSATTEPAPSGGTLKDVNPSGFTSLNRWCRGKAKDWPDDLRQVWWEALAWAVSGGRTTHLGELTPSEASDFRSRVDDHANGRARWVETDDPRFLGWTLTSEEAA